MDKHIEQAVNASLDQFEKVASFPVSDFKNKIADVFDSDEDFMTKVSLMDEAFDDEPHLEALREVFFDLLMVNFFSEDVKKLEEDYLESEEWEDIEEETIDRGTELLNVLLYLRECRDEDIEPGLEDFLKEFLLVDEDEFQDEYRIYEDVIANQVLMESPVEEIAKVAKNLPESSEFKELFYPVMCFFQQNTPSEHQTEVFIRNSVEPEFDSSVFALLVAFNKN
ncbi:hypothetical protein [Arcticibacter tournemirensis]|uniref:Uncharacterized protein n=1 Tax=Arcticibacter tournemirensis TaxID=699437 RepID=A0A4Q0M926_9SPHI|nr:hypothetical protein [Arcticibacter tournemirensis]RXF69634.1 hypothetical protein EKH83_10245 [Arcticibacter tournemirensis]